MKFSSSTTLLSALPLAVAFPAQLIQKFQNDPNVFARAEEVVALAKRQQGADAATAIFEGIPTFDAAAQLIDVSEGSGHEWQAPGPNDLRGECPGLNAFANHGFLPRNGIASVLQYTQITQQIVGMGADLAVFLAVLGALIDSGDLMTWSMGGPPPAGVASIAGQQGTGLIGSHNKYENDVSPTRPDLYLAGNNYITSASQFQELVNANPGDEVTLAGLTEFRSQRFDYSVANNPYFFNAPFPGVLVQPAAFQFIYRFMANHTAEAPLGTLDYKTLQAWFGIEGENGNYTAVQGYERIPDNWYRRSLTAPYTIPYFLGDVVAAAALHPKFLNIGGNLGKTNTFAGVDLGNLTGGLFNTADLLKGNNLGCFAFQVATQVKGDFAVAAIVNGVETALGNIVSQLGCPQLQAIDEAQLEQFPGYQKAPSFGKK